MQQPHPDLEIGGKSLVSHALWQLNSAHFSEVIVVVGFRGDSVQKQLAALLDSESELFGGMTVQYVDLGKGWRGGRVASIVAAGEKIRQSVKQDGSFVIVGSDRIFDVPLLQQAADVNLSENGDEAAVLVETCIEGMVGLPPSTVFCAMRPLHGADRIYSIGSDIETYSGVDAGMLVFDTSTLQKLADMANSAGEAGKVRVADMLSGIAQNGTLRMMKTDDHTWFSVETPESAEFAKEGLRTSGQDYELADGRKVKLIGLPTRRTDDGAGGEWSEFSVDKWRSAVYTAKSFFQDLFVDTTDFIGKLCDELGGKGPDGPLLVEVGCGTGEALLPLFDRAPYVCGVDFNPKFVEFCSQNVAHQYKDRVRHIVGDASDLINLLKAELPAEWVDDKRPKVITCVGNTIGIIPPEIRKEVYQQMMKLAGPNGYFVIVYWNGNTFGEAVQHFYHKNPQLCGPFTGESINLETQTLTTPSGYCTKWTGPEEARDIFEREIGAEVHLLEEKGRGVLVAGRLRA